MPYDHHHAIMISITLLLGSDPTKSWIFGKKYLNICDKWYGEGKLLGWVLTNLNSNIVGQMVEMNAQKKNN